MRLEVRSINMNRDKQVPNKFGGIRREDIGVYDADTGEMINGIQELRLTFNCKETASLELDILWKRDGEKNEFTFNEDDVYGHPANSFLTHRNSQRMLEGVQLVNLDDDKGIMTIGVIDFDTKLDILRPFKRDR